MLQSAIQRHDSASDVLPGITLGDTFEFVGGGGVGVWGFRSTNVPAWMANNGRACNFTLATGSCTEGFQRDRESWLLAQQEGSPGAWLRIAKKEAPFASLSKAEAIDAALCHGWIDGQFDKYDLSSWLIRFTPRTPHSKWSQVNRTRALELLAEERIAPRGLTEIEAAKADGRWEAAYAPASKAQVPPDLQDALNANAAAAEFFASLTGANRYAILYRIGAVKQAETRARKIAKFVVMLARGESIHG